MNRLGFGRRMGGVKSEQKCPKPANWGWLDRQHNNFLYFLGASESSDIKRYIHKSAIHPFDTFRIVAENGFLTTLDAAYSCLFCFFDTHLDIYSSSSFFSEKITLSHQVNHGYPLILGH